jgi:hypothetical protein
LSQGLTQAGWNSRSSCLYLPNAGSTDMCHHIWLKAIFNKTKSGWRGSNCDRKERVFHLSSLLGRHRPGYAVTQVLSWERKHVTQSNVMESLSCPSYIMLLDSM